MHDYQLIWRFVNRAYLLSQLYVFWIIANEEEMRTMLTPTLLEMATFR